MEKKSKKSIMIGITTILLVTLTLLGLTYAYYRTRIIGNNADKSISVTSKLLEVTYSDGSSNVEIGSLVEPSNDKVYTKTFTVTNTGDGTASYSILLEDMENTFQRNQDWKYTLTVGSETIASGYLAVGTHQILVARRELTKVTNEEVYTLSLKYVNSEEDQSEDMGQTLSFRINISDETNTWDNAKEGTLLYALKNNQPTGREETIPGKEASTENEARLLTTEDDYGTSYVYRGNVLNNYVNYSGMCWRIVRVQGDGTIKLVLADRDNGCKTEEGYDLTDGQSAFIADPTIQGFTYLSRYTESDEILDIMQDLVYNNSTMPAILNAWINGGTYKYVDVADTWEEVEGTFSPKISNEDQDKLVTTEWCNDTSVISKSYFDEEGNEIDSSNTALLEGTLYSYGTYDRLYKKENKSPTLKCNMEGMVIGTYQTTANRVNSKIGLLTADEIAFAGNVFDPILVKHYYLETNAKNNHWIMSPSNIFQFVGGGADISNMYVTESGKLFTDTLGLEYSIRPSVVLRSDVIVETGGNGTQTNPYVIN